MRIDKRILVLLLILLLSGSLSAGEGHYGSMSLTGLWSVKLDLEDRGEASGWATGIIGEPIRLPGTLDDAGIGAVNRVVPDMNTESLVRLRRKYTYVGAAWYTRDIDIPTSWSGKNIVLTLERVLWRSRIFVDGVEFGGGESLTTGHQIELGKLSPGTHTLVVMIDNRLQYQISGKADHQWTKYMCHSYTDETQVIWNGVVGDLKLDAYGDVQLGSVSVFPFAERSDVEVQVEMVNYSGRDKHTKLELEIKSPDNRVLLKQSVNLDVSEGTSVQQLRVPVKNIALWDEFSPNVYTLDVKLSGKSVQDSETTLFGFRTLRADGTCLMINGRRLYLRGEVDCAVFPLTGYPPTDIKSWKQIFSTYKRYGLNHVRFHSWCPPSAAFETADKMGMYLQVELPIWAFNVGLHAPTNAFIKREATRMIAEYGNHPSFCFWSMGNELDGDFRWLEQFVSSLREQDRRRLYTTTTFTFAKGHGTDAEPADDYLLTQWTKNGWARCQGVFDYSEPRFDVNFTTALKDIKVPVVVHEIGQYSIFPDLNEIGKYVGNLTPVNLLSVQADLRAKGRENAAESYYKATGAFAGVLYKGEIESHLRTPESNGFQLLGLKDFPGQGTAIVGMLDAFGEDKEIAQDSVWRQYCSSVVPLFTFGKVVYKDGEQFTGRFSLANFSPKTISSTVLWRLFDEDGKSLSLGALAGRDYQPFTRTEGDAISVQLTTAKAQKLTFEITVAGTPYRNSWNIWCYPDISRIGEEQIAVATTFEQLDSLVGKAPRIMFLPGLADVKKGITTRFTPVFWSAVLFADQPGTMGILCDPQHPAFEEFPTDSHADWQWWYLLSRSKAVQLPEHLASTVVVQALDNIATNRLMALTFEVNVEGSSVLVCTSDLANDLEARLPAAQLGYSLCRSVASEDFKPATRISRTELFSLMH